MNAHPIPHDADLVSLCVLNRKWEIEDALADRKRRRLAKSKAARLGWEARRAAFRQADAFRAAVLPQDDWAPCPTCKFILVACDCDGQHFGNSPGRFGPRPDSSETRPVHAMKGL